ncbi:hypothetical protein SAMN05444277_1291 [Parafilimonas terrae]|uniref:Uncharacterized protein n=1 Tax=Parafilimonas terrae TaxID=1465490 RepID=A0A1I5ZH74_9BACT|nr:hypothetical protein SAMN05444277_1291 [Parafilimonas terrae]
MLLILSCKSGDNKNCSKFHSGRFISHEALGQRTIIDRLDSIQIETNEQTGHVFKSKIRWINDCEYQLTDFFEKLDSTDSFKPWLPGKVVATKLIGATSKYCIYESKMSDVSMTLRDTLWILEN